jgi:hypothetical protein
VRNRGADQQEEDEDVHDYYIATSSCEELLFPGTKPDVDSSRQVSSSMAHHKCRGADVGGSLGGISTLVKCCFDRYILLFERLCLERVSFVRE